MTTMYEATTEMHPDREGDGFLELKLTFYPEASEQGREDGVNEHLVLQGLYFDERVWKLRYTTLDLGAYLEPYVLSKDVDQLLEDLLFLSSGQLKQRELALLSNSEPIPASISKFPEVEDDGGFADALSVLTQFEWMPA